MIADVFADASQQTYAWSQSAAGIVIVLGGLGTAVAFVGRIFWKKVDAKISAVDKKATPNGGHTLDLGDTAARTESKVDELRGMFMLHLQNHPGPGVPAVAQLEAKTPSRVDVAHAVALDDPVAVHGESSDAQ